MLAGYLHVMLCINNGKLLFHQVSPYYIFAYASAISALMVSISCMFLMVCSAARSFLLFLIEIDRTSFLGCISKKYLKVKDLAYTILWGLTSSTTLLPSDFTNSLKLSNTAFVPTIPPSPSPSK